MEMQLSKPVAVMGELVDGLLRISAEDMRIEN
jgi:hypothetical protein